MNRNQFHRSPPALAIASACVLSLALPQLHARNARLHFYNGGIMNTPASSLALLAQTSKDSAGPGSAAKSAQLFVSSYTEGTVLRVGRDRSGFAAPLAAEYFDQRDFKGKRVRRSETQIDHDWQYGAPVKGFGPDTFSVRWTGRLRAGAAGEYRFTTTSDDGVRLWVNGKKIIDRWYDQGPTDHSGKIQLKAGATVAIRMDYYENGGGAVARLRWQPPGTRTASLIRLSGGFAARESQATGLSSRALAAGDWNGDGVTDLAAANFHPGGSVRVLLGSKQARFAGESDPSTDGVRINNAGDDPIAIALRDANGDKNAELFVLNQSSGDLRVFTYASGRAELLTRLPLPQSRPQALHVADLDGDRRADCLVLMSDRVLVYLNQSGTVPFANSAVRSITLPATFLRGTEGAMDFAAGDFNRDGKLDLAVAAYAAKQQAVRVQLLAGQNTGGEFAAVKNQLSFAPDAADDASGALAESGPAIAAADLDGDGAIDLITTHPTRARLALFRNSSRTPKARLTAGVFLLANLPALPAAASAISAADFNGDGALDLAVLHTTRNLLSVFFAGKR